MSEPLRIEDLRIGMIVVVGDKAGKECMGEIRVIDGRSSEVAVWFGFGLQVAYIPVSDLRRHVPVEPPAPTDTDVALDKASKTVEDFPAWMKRPEVSGKPATPDPVKAIAERTVLTFRDKLIIAVLGGYWADPSAAGNFSTMLADVDGLIAEMAKVKP